MCQNTGSVPRRNSSSGLRVLNFGVLAAAYAVLLSRIPGASPQFTLASVAGGVALVLAALVTFAAGPRKWLERAAAAIPPPLAVLLTVLPWAVLFALVARHGLWWTQRPSSLRLFAALLLINWSLAIGAAPLDGRIGPDAARRAVSLIAAALAVIGVQGLAFGVTPFGAAVSTLIAGAAAIAFMVARRGRHTSNLKVFAAAAAAILAFAFAEAAVRLLHIGQNVQEIDSREFAREFYSLTPPGSAFVNQPKALDEFGPALVEINSMGIRGPEIAAGRADWLLIGDSMIEARQLPWEETVAARLQESARARSLPLTIVGHGMRGWSPLLEWNWYLEVGRRLNPQTVFLFFFWNDLWTDGSEVTAFRAVLRPDGRPDYFDVVVEPAWIWYKRVRLVRLLEESWRRASVTQLRRGFATMTGGTVGAGVLDEAAADRLARDLTGAPLSAAQLQKILTAPGHELDPELRDLASTSFWPSMRPWSLWTERQRTAAAHTELELQRFAEDVRADGARFVVVFVPNPLQIGPRECSVGRLFDRVEPGVMLPPESGIQTWLRSVAERHGFELLDPSAAMRTFVAAHRGAPPLYLRADCHWSPRGHQFMADYLLDWHTGERQRNGQRGE
jgi:hypothetical protein